MDKLYAISRPADSSHGCWRCPLAISWTLWAIWSTRLERVTEVPELRSRQKLGSPTRGAYVHKYWAWSLFCLIRCLTGLKKSTSVKRLKSMFTIHLGPISNLLKSEEGAWEIILLIMQQSKVTFEDCGKRMPQLLNSEILKLKNASTSELPNQTLVVITTFCLEQSHYWYIFNGCRTSYQEKVKVFVQMDVPLKIFWDERHHKS